MLALSRQQFMVLRGRPRKRLRAAVGRLLSAASAYKLVADLERLGILKEMTGGKRGRTYTFEPYVKLFR
jgi:hypothetical protein